MAARLGDGRLNNFDFLRFFFALLVVFSHSYPLATGSEAAEPLALFSQGQMTFGALAVDCFFIISGFLITQSWSNRPHVLAFLEKRVRRIYPGFLMAAALGAFVVPALFSAPGVAWLNADLVTRFLANAPRLIAITPHGAFADNPARGTINGSLWSISYEFWCYFLVLVVGLRQGLRRPVWLVGLLVVCIVVSFVFVRLGLTPGGKFLGVIFGYPPFWARLLPYFVAGMAFYVLRNRVPLSAGGALLASASIVVSLAFPYASLFVLPPAAAYLIFWVAFVPCRPLQGFANHGDLSYGIYLYAFPLEQIIVSLHGGQMQPLSLFLLSVPACLVAAFLSWHGLEKHFLHRGRPARLVQSPTSTRA